MKATQRIREVLKLSKTNKKLKPCKLIMLYIFQARIGFRKADRITKVGFTLTFIWLLTIFATSTFRNKPVWCLSLNEFGDFLAGSFAPLAFFWFVIGYFQQGKELQLQREELALQRQELNYQGEQTKRLADTSEMQTELNQRKIEEMKKDISPKLLYLDKRITPTHSSSNSSEVVSISFKNIRGTARNFKITTTSNITQLKCKTTLLEKGQESLISFIVLDRNNLPAPIVLSYFDLKYNEYEHRGLLGIDEEQNFQFFDKQFLLVKGED